MTTIPLYARVSQSEEAAVLAAAGQLVMGLAAACAVNIGISPVFVQSVEALAGSPAGALHVVSLVPELLHLDELWSNQEKRLRREVEALAALGSVVFILTILRHAGQDEDPELLYRRRVRIRRLNLLAAELSQETGAFVVDVDRVLADIGGRNLQTDYRLDSPAATVAAGCAIALCIAANGLDGYVSVEAQDKARDLISPLMPNFDASPSLVPTDIMTLGRGRRAQAVATNVELEGGAQVLKLVRQAINREFAVGDALAKLAQVIRRRGMIQSGLLIMSAMLQMTKGARR